MIAGSKLQAFLKTACKEPTPELRAGYFANKKVVMQLLVISLKPMTAEKKAQGLVGENMKRPGCLQGQNHEGSFDVSNAFLNAELSEDVV